MPFLKDHFDGFPWQMGSLWHHLHNYSNYKTSDIQMHRMHEQKGWVVWCLHLLHKVFEIWPLLTLNWTCLPYLDGEQPSQGEGLGCT